LQIKHRDGIGDFLKRTVQIGRQGSSAYPRSGEHAHSLYAIGMVLRQGIEHIWKQAREQATVATTL
jgi:hypothetical protein